MTEPRAISPPAMTLSALRRRLGRSQAEVATAIGTTQSGVSRIEHQSDMRVSTLDDYVNSLGGRLRLIVEHGTDDLDIIIPSVRRDHSYQSREFRVIWQDKETRSLVHVGWLEFTGNQYLFSYTDEARSHPRFPALPNAACLRQDLQVRRPIPLLCGPAHQHGRPSVRRCTRRARTHTRRRDTCRTAGPVTH